MDESQSTLANMEDVRGKLGHGCALLKTDGGFRMMEWMISVGTVYKKRLIEVRLFEQTGKLSRSPISTSINSATPKHPL